MRRKYIIALVVAAVVAGLGYGGYLKYVDHIQEQDRLLAQQAAEEAHKKRTKEIEDEKRAMEAYRQRMIQQAVAPAALSPWLESEKAIYRRVIELARPTVIVVPPMVPPEAKGIDISARITMARMVAAALGNEAGQIPDPALVYRALGEARQVSVAELRQKFSMTNATWLVVGNAQHDGKGRMRVTLSKVPLRKPEGAEPAPGFDRDGIEFDGVHPPEMQFAPVAAEAALALGFASSAISQPIPKASPLTLPSGPLEATKGDDFLANLWVQQLIGALQTPNAGAQPRPKERVFERVLAAALAMPREAPDRAVLLARSLAYLERREAAIAVLEGAGPSAEERALDAYLRADIPALSAAAAQTKRPIARLISELELLELQGRSGVLRQEAIKAAAQRLGKSVPPGWQPLVAYYVLGLDVWSLPSPETVKLLLDRDFSLPGFSLQDIARGRAAVTGTVDDKFAVELFLSPFQHARRWREAHARELCCGTGLANWSRFEPSEYLDFLEAEADYLSAGKLQFLSQTQGLPDQMTRLADLYDQALFEGGNPSVVQQRLHGLVAMGRNAGTGERRRIALEAFELARKLLTWEPSQSATALVALEARNGFYGDFVQSRENSKYGPERLPQHKLEFDRPARSYWSTYIGRISSAASSEFRLESGRTACVETRADISACVDYVDALRELRGKQEVAQAVKELIEPRFNGYSQRIELMVAVLRESGDTEGARELLRQAVRVPNAPLKAYESLGNLYREAGEFPAAAQAFLSYPGLKDRYENTVRMSNYLGTAGFALASRGGVREARPLFERAALNRDGSNASLTSAARLSVLDGDFGGAMELLRQAYQRYHKPEAAGQVASMLFMVGESESAWTALRGILPAAPDFAPYRAVPVGMRADAFDDEAMLKWREDALGQAASAGRQGTSEFFDLALMQTILLDHRSMDSADKMFQVNATVMFPRPARATPGASTAAPIMRYAISPPGTRLFRGYTAFRKGDHAAAASAWGDLVKDFDVNAYPPMFGDIQGGSFWSAMPYLAFSLAKTGRAGEAKALPTRLTKEGRPAGSRKIPDGMAQVPMPDFDRLMIEAIVEALSGNHDKAVALLRAAQGSMAPPGARLIPPDYAFAEILELLSRETNQPLYLSMAVNFARAYRQYEPWAAWAYAFEASNMPAGPEQTRVAALALKLNPQSIRFGNLDPKVQREAKNILSKGNPFRIAPPVIKQRS